MENNTQIILDLATMKHDLLPIAVIGVAIVFFIGIPYKILTSETVKGAMQEGDAAQKIKNLSSLVQILGPVFLVGVLAIWGVYFFAAQ